METWLIWLIWILYGITMFFFAFKPNVLGFGRPLVGLTGASLIVVIQDLAAEISGNSDDRQRVDEDVDYDIIIYLFALMIISHYFELTGLDRVPQAAFRWSMQKFGALGLVWSVSLLTGIVAIFFTNDMAVFLLTPSVIRIVRDKQNAASLEGLDLLFMMNLATNANLASAMSPIGNPQNVLVSTVGNIDFGDFFGSIILAATVCWFLNTILLSVWLFEIQGKIRVFGRIADLFRRKSAATPYSALDDANSRSQPLLGDTSAALSINNAAVSESANATEDSASQMSAEEHRKRHNAVDPLYTGGPRPRSSTVGDVSGQTVKDPGRGREDIRELVSMPGERAHKLAEEQSKAEMPPKVRTVLMVTASIAFILWIVLVAVVPDIYLGWATLLTALFVMVAHEMALKITRTPRVVNPGDAVFRVTDVIDFGLLFMFWAQFVLIGALLRTNVPQDLFTQLIDAFGQDIVRLWFVMALLYAVIFASNILTNVPIILLLAPLINCLPCPAEYGFPEATPECYDGTIPPIFNSTAACVYPCPGDDPRPICPAYFNGDSKYENYTAFIGWIIIAWAATIAGNLTLVGSAANLIVDSRARTVGAPELKFAYYFPYGFPTTIIFSFIGLILILLVVGGL